MSTYVGPHLLAFSAWTSHACLEWFDQDTTVPIRCPTPKVTAAARTPTTS
jgi:hypothetical protein